MRAGCSLVDLLAGPTHLVPNMYGVNANDFLDEAKKQGKNQEFLSLEQSGDSIVVLIRLSKLHH